MKEYFTEQKRESLLVGLNDIESMLDKVKSDIEDKVSSEDFVQIEDEFMTIYYKIRQLTEEI